MINVATHQTCALITVASNADGFTFVHTDEGGLCGFFYLDKTRSPLTDLTEGNIYMSTRACNYIN